jgi:Holliday junction resolvasome RuvABC ATP-dependent DNA helicase subunit
VQLIAASTMSTKRNGAPFRHVLLHGPPGELRLTMSDCAAAAAGD